MSNTISPRITPEESERGLLFLEGHEGVVLRAYRCPAGRWTIGAGLTAASGVVEPRAGMVITQMEARALLRRACREKYMPAVEKAMPGARGTELVGGLSFDFNTGAIGRASWVDDWRRGASAAVRAGLMKWVRGGGKVLPGLERRRREEADLIIHGIWPKGLGAPARPTPHANLARVALILSPSELAAVRQVFAKLGFAPGSDVAGVAQAAVVDFQTRHGLTVDGIIGRATLSTLQRELDAREAMKTTGVAAGGGAAAGATGTVGGDAAGQAADTLVAVGGIALSVAIIAGLVMAWRYRDVIAARIHRPFPRLARWLRSR